MCRGCRLRERIVQRLHEKLAHARALLAHASEAIDAVVIDSAGPTRTPTPARRAPPKARPGPSAPPAARGEKPAQSHRAQQLTLAL